MIGVLGFLVGTVTGMIFTGLLAIVVAINIGK